MQSTPMNFARTEKKYLLTRENTAAVVKALSGHLAAETRGLYPVESLYLDAPDDLLIRRSLDKPYYKEKLRLRSYGVPAESDEVYLELKKKCGGVVYKRRAGMTAEAARAYLDTGILPGDGQILRELDWAMKRYGAVPKAVLCYDRLAFLDPDGSDLRVTFDFHVRARDTDLDLCAGSAGVPLLPEGATVMEIKTAGAIPLWLCRTIEQLGIAPTSFSKYGSFYQLQNRTGASSCLKAS